MSNEFFEKPILNLPYGYPARRWALDESGQPTQKITESRRRAEFITPIPKPLDMPDWRFKRCCRRELSRTPRSG